MPPRRPAAKASAPAGRPPRSRPSFLWDVLALRVVNAVSIATLFQPDEFFQSLEPAWDIAFGSRSGAWLTWEWHHQLRSSLHPALFSVFYTIAGRLSGLLPPGSPARGILLVGAPKLPQALFAALGDWYTFQLAVKIYGSNSLYSYSALFLQVVSPWQWYCSTRTFSNSLETTLTAMALYYWPWPLLAPAEPIKGNPRTANLLGNPWHLRLSLFLAALAVVLRPTNGLIWLTIAALALTRAGLQGPSPLTRPVLAALVREAALAGSLVLGLAAASDRLYFGAWTFPPYQWLHFNISQSLAVFYGRNPWHYYLLQGLPLLCTTALPFALRALSRPAGASSSPAQTNALRALAATVLTTVAALSLISHKEVRFIYPLLPALHVLAAPFAASFFATRQPPPSGSKPASATPRLRLRHKPYLAAALAINVLLAGYLSFLHQPAPLNVLAFLRGQYERAHPSAAVLITHPSANPPQPSGGAGSSDDLFALFLTPCHSTPWRSHLVYPDLAAYALSCEPPLHTAPGSPARADYRDEADRFYDAPVGFLAGELFGPHGRGLPSPPFVVAFEGVEPWLHEFLDQTDEGRARGWRLRQVWSGFNGFANEDWRRAGRMVVWDTGVYGAVPAGHGAAQ